MRVVRSCDFCGDDATGLYQPLPASVPDGPRLLLCDGCRDRLASVVDPLVERFEGGDAGASAGGGQETPAGAGEGTERRPPEAGASQRRGQDPPEDEGGRSRNQPAGEPEAADDAVASGVQDGGVGGAVSESRDASGRSQPDRAGTPHGYRKAMRFLENRELPIERAQAVRLVAEAYDLEDGDVEQCIDHAVQYGRLREVDGELTR